MRKKYGFERGLTCDLDLEEQISSIAITIHLTQTSQTQTGSLLNARGDRYQEGPLF